jgi:arylsulfatase A
MHPPVESVNQYPEEWDDRVYRGQCGYLPHPRPRAGYAAMISDLDRHVGAVVAELEKNGILDQTLIVFTSDNGTTHRSRDERFGIGGCDADFFNSTNGLRAFKGSVYEGGIRVPMIVRYPSAVKKGASNDTPGYFADWFPTLCAAAGIRAPHGLDGENLWPVITGGEALTNRKPMIWTFAGYGGQIAVRIGDMKVVRQKVSSKKPGPWEVYDLASDIGETTDLSTRHPELVKQAIAILKKEMSPNDIFPLTIPGGNS